MPVRQLMVRHLALVSMSSAGIDEIWNLPLTGTTALGNRTDHPHIGRVHLEVPRNTDCPGKFASCEPLTERRAQPITGIR